MRAPRPTLVSAVALLLAPAALAGPPARLPRDLALVDLAGRTWTAADLAGRKVALDFWATWCAPCVRERARVAQLRARQPESQLALLSVNLDHGDRRHLVSWLNRRRLDWPQIHEPLGWASPTARTFAVPALPWSVVYEADGRLAGAGPDIESLLAGRPTGTPRAVPATAKAGTTRPGS